MMQWWPQSLTWSCPSLPADAVLLLICRRAEHQAAESSHSALSYTSLESAANQRAESNKHITHTHVITGVRKVYPLKLYKLLFETGCIPVHSANCWWLQNSVRFHFSETGHRIQQARPAGTRPPPPRIPFTAAVDCSEWDAGEEKWVPAAVQHNLTASRVNWCLTATSSVTVVTSHREITERQWRVNVRTSPTYGNTWRRSATLRHSAICACVNLPTFIMTSQWLRPTAHNGRPRRLSVHRQPSSRRDWAVFGPPGMLLTSVRGEEVIKSRRCHRPPRVAQKLWRHYGFQLKTGFHWTGTDCGKLWFLNPYFLTQTAMWA